MGANKFEDAVEAKDLEAATVFEPADEIVKEVISDDKLNTWLGQDWGQP